MNKSFFTLFPTVLRKNAVNRAFFGWILTPVRVFTMNVIVKQFSLQFFKRKAGQLFRRRIHKNALLLAVYNKQRDACVISNGFKMPAAIFFAALV